MHTRNAGLGEEDYENSRYLTCSWEVVGPQQEHCWLEWLDWQNQYSGPKAGSFADL